jgi:hypothetical protein
MWLATLGVLFLFGLPISILPRRFRFPVLLHTRLQLPPPRSMAFTGSPLLCGKIPFYMCFICVHLWLEKINKIRPPPSRFENN